MEHNVVVEHSEAAGVENQPEDIEKHVNYVHFKLCSGRGNSDSDSDNKNNKEDKEGNCVDNVGIDNTRHHFPHSHNQRPAKTAEEMVLIEKTVRMKMRAPGSLGSQATIVEIIKPISVQTRSSKPAMM